MNRRGNPHRQERRTLSHIAADPSQAENRELAIERFLELMREALRKVPKKEDTSRRRGQLADWRRKAGASLLKGQRSKRVPVED